MRGRGAGGPPGGPVDVRTVVAVAWIGVALGLTAVFGPILGARGWVWLGMHHLLCAVGCGHELLVAAPRRRAARASREA